MVHYLDVFSVTQRYHGVVADVEDDGHARKKRGTNTVSNTVNVPSVPEGMSAKDTVSWISNQLGQLSHTDPKFAGYLFQLVTTLKAAVAADTKPPFKDVGEWVGILVLDCCRLAFHAFVTQRTGLGTAFFKATHAAFPFFSEIQEIRAGLPCPAANRWELEQMAVFVTTCSTDTSVPKIPKPTVMLEQSGEAHSLALPKKK